MLVQQFQSEFVWFSHIVYSKGKVEIHYLNLHIWIYTFGIHYLKQTQHSAFSFVFALSLLVQERSRDIDELIK
jgi:hypothetical protein